MQCEYFALEGLSALIRYHLPGCGTVGESSGLARWKGMLRTMYDPRNSLTNDVSSQQLQQPLWRAPVYRTVIPRNVRLAEAPSFGVPAIQYDP